MATLQVVHKIADPSYSNWEGITNVEYEYSYDAENNQTTVTFLEGFFRYYGIANHPSDATANITVKAADNEESTASATMTCSGNTYGYPADMAATSEPTSITVQHSSELGEKSVVISVDSVINVYITEAGKSSVRGSESATIVMGDRQGMVSIDMGTEWKHFTPYIDTGSGWKQYVPYRDTGTGWEICQ